MSIQKVNGPVWKPFAAQNILQTVQGTTSEWHDVSGWTDKTIWVNATVTDGSGSIDINVDMLQSPKDAYTLNNEATVDTQDYLLVQIVDGLTSGILTKYDSDDVDDLKHPCQSLAFVVDNDDATDPVTITIWVEGWS